MIAGLLVLILFQVQTLRTHRPGETPWRNPDDYGFDFSTCLIPRDDIIATDAGRTDVPPLSQPELLAGAEVRPGVRLAGLYTLVSKDRVIGVEIEGRARAYPLWVLAAHEACNDTLGGRAILVTYNPLCDSAAVFDRLVDEQSMTFAASGLVWNSGLLLRDERDKPADESLWSQLQCRAVTGPAAQRGQILTLLPAALTTWAAWKQRFPATDVVLPQPRWRKLYRPNAYLTYYNDEKLRYPVSPLPASGELRLKTPIAALYEAGAWRVVPVSQESDAFWAEPRLAIYSFWFAWYATHPD